MAHGNGRIYIDTSVTPNKGLTIADFQAIFGTNRNTLGDIIMYATARGLVNVWAKYKGVRSTKLGILALAERQDADFGIYIPACMTANGLSAFMSAYVSGYEYLWPRGEGNTPKEWFRRRDFNGYNHNANCFVNVYDLTLPSTYLVGAGDTGCGFHVGFNAGNNLHQDSVGISDLKLGGSSGTTFGDLYFGLLFVAGGTNKLVTSGSKLSVDVSTYGGGECRIVESNGDLEGITRNTVYTVYPVLSLLSHTSPTSFTQQDRLVALPLSPFSFKTQSVVTQQNIAVLSCSASMNRGALQVDFVVGMAATGGAPTSMTAAYVVYAASASGDETGEQLMSGTITGLTTTQNQEVQRSIQTTNPIWIRVYVYNQNNNQVNNQAWAQVHDGPVDPDE